MGKQTYTNVGGVWKKNNKIHTNVSSTWKEVKKGYVNIGGVWKQTHSAGGLPAGIILPYNSSSAVPTGFTEYTSADNKFIVGAGSSYVVSSTGGSTTVSVSSTSSTNGSHTGTTFQTGYKGSIYSGVNSVYASGNHSHTISASDTVEPTYKTFRLIKAAADIGGIPAAVGVLSATTLANGMTAESSSGEYIKASTTLGLTGGSLSVSISGTTSTSGAHNHGGVNGYSPSDESTWYRYLYNQGGHSHSVTLSGTIEPQYKYLSLWSNAVAASDTVPSIIGMWEGTSAPDGWTLCDGTNGSPDMRDYFLRLGDNGNHGTSGGSSNITLTGSTASGGSHQHRGASTSNGFNNKNTYHSNTKSMAGHTFSWSSTYTPPYYALTFIMKLDA